MDLFKNLEKIYTNNKGKIIPNVMILGAPGIGKSAQVLQLTKNLGISFLDLRLAQMDVSDLRGVMAPNYEKQCTELFKSKLLDLPSAWKGIILLDELPSANKMLQVAAYQILQERCIGDIILPKGAWLLAAGNREEDFAIVNPIPSTIMSRFIQFELKVNESFTNNWLDWAMKNGIHSSILAFIHKYPSFIFEAPESEGISFACPRVWANFSFILDQNLDEETINHVGQLMLGQNVFSHYVVLHKLIDKIKPAVDYLDKKEKIPEGDLKYLALFEISSYLARNVNESNINKFVKLVDSLYEDKDSNKESLIILLVTVLRNSQLVNSLGNSFESISEKIAELKIRRITK